MPRLPVRRTREVSDVLRRRDALALKQHADAPEAGWVRQLDDGAPQGVMEASRALGGGPFGERLANAERAEVLRLRHEAQASQGLQLHQHGSRS